MNCNIFCMHIWFNCLRGFGHRDAADLQVLLKGAVILPVQSENTISQLFSALKGWLMFPQEQKQQIPDHQCFQDRSGLDTSELRLYTLDLPA